jgi:hypothetical protein
METIQFELNHFHSGNTIKLDNRPEKHVLNINTKKVKVYYLENYKWELINEYDV